MFAKIAEFFIKNSKITIVLLIVSLVVWLWSYIILPKQYNPTIIVPAFQVSVPAPGLDTKEISKIVVSPLENKIMELEWIDDVYGYATDNFAWVMVKFHVWVDKEKAKIRLIQKIRENMMLKPIWVKDPLIQTIDPDELPQIVYAIKYKWDKLNQEESSIYLRQIANIIKEKVKTIENVTTLDIVWGYKKNIVVELDLNKIKAKNTDIMAVYQALEKNNINLPAWNINQKTWEKIFVELNWKFDNIESLKKLVIGNIMWNIIYLEDVASIRYGVKRLNKSSTYYSSGSTNNMVLFWVWKAIWTNAVFVTQDVQKKINEVKKELPKDIEIEVIQNEWAKAQNATNMLLVNLVQSIIIVFLVLAVYLWVKDAFNTAVSIPLTLALVFVFALIAWENINKITLFALILVLWMLVDNSTVVVENISRHLNERIKTRKTKLEAVLEWTQEVWAWVILATFSRLLAFGSMFAVTGMMWEYMKPIPKFAIWALLISIAIAFTINPWISYLSAKDVNESDSEHKEKESPLKIRKKYLAFMRLFISNTKRAKTNRKIFRFSFWISLFLILILPIYFGIFKARMLPKSNQNQIYLWIDAPRWWNIEKTSQVEKDLAKWLLDEKNTNKVVENITSVIGQHYTWDFANLFRWGLNRIWENQISARINLTPPNKYEELTWETRPSSEFFTIQIRENFKKYLLAKYPDLKIKLLEDPPGPPVRSTFLIKIKTNANEKSTNTFVNRVYKEVQDITPEQKLVDIGTSKSTTYRKLKIDLDHESISRAWLTIEQVEYSLAIALNWMDISLVKNYNSFEPTNIEIVGKKQQIDNIDLLKTISFTNPKGEKIPLTSIATIKNTFVNPEINTDWREETIYIYWEMWDNSLIYPVIKLYWILMDENFLGNDYKLDSWSPYEIKYTGLKDGKKYIIEWWGEWELTMDTFRDLGMAMAISLLAIYFLLVWQFASFWVAGIIMITFLLGFFWVWPGFTFLYLTNNEYFSATSMIWVIALAWIVVWNAIILIEYLNTLKKNWLTIKDALLKAGYVRFAPIILTSLTTVFGAATIIWDPVWAWLAWAIIWWLSISSFLTLIVIPIFYYDSQEKEWEKCLEKMKTCDEK